MECKNQACKGLPVVVLELLGLPIVNETNSTTLEDKDISCRVSRGTRTAGKGFQKMSASHASGKDSTGIARIGRATAVNVKDAVMVVSHD